MFFFKPLISINQISQEALWDSVMIQTWMWSLLNRRGSEQCWKCNEGVSDLSECKWRAVYLRGLHLLFDFNFASHCFKEVVWAELQLYFLGIHKIKVMSIILFCLKQKDSQLHSVHCLRTEEISPEFLKGTFLVIREHTFIGKA